jgi:DnaJ-class molecular chaperone
MAFKRLAGKWHPSRNPSAAAAHEERFALICEAYEVLSSKERKAIFDMYGEFGLKNGVTNHLGQKLPRYMFLDNADDIYTAFFNAHDPLSQNFEVDGSDVFGSILGDGAKGKNAPAPPAPQHITIDLPCTLRDLYCGVMKSISYERAQISPDGFSIKMVSQTKSVEVKPGTHDGSVETYPREGNEAYGHGRSDLKVKISLQNDAADECTACYEREGSDLIYTHTLSLKDAIACAPMRLETLNARVLTINLDRLITPQMVHTIAGEGMPSAEAASKEAREENALKNYQQLPRGDLYVRFNILFPDNLTAEKKAAIASLLRD